MKHLKKSICGLIVLLLCLNTICLTNFETQALDATGNCNYNISYSYDKTTKKLVLSGNGAMRDYGYNYDYNYDDPSPFENSDIETVIISEGVTSIGDRAFYGCTALKKVIIANTVTSIGDYAFSGCINLSNIELPNSLIQIGEGAFWLSGIESVIIPENVTTIGEDALLCESLIYISVERNNQCYFSDENGVLFNKDKTTLIQYPINNSSAEYIIPNGVQIIDSNAFYCCNNLTKISIPSSCKTMNLAFVYCNTMSDIYYSGTLLDYLKITLNNLPHYSLHCSDGIFNGTKGLFGNDLIWVFDYLTNSLHIIGNGEMNCDNVPWNNSKVRNVIIHDGITSITNEFYECKNLETISIPKSITNIDNWAFYLCYNLKEIIVDEENENYSSDEYGALFDKNKTILWRYPVGNERESYIIPDGVKTIFDFAFNNCDSIKSIVIPNTVTEFGPVVFEGCTNLKTIKISNAITTIAPQNFYACESLTDVFYEGTEEQWNAITIEYNNDCLMNAKTHFNHQCIYTIRIVEESTHLKEGKGIYSCECGYNYVGVIAKLEGHTYEKIVTEPTCTAKGYTTYTCACGESYVDNYTDKLDHEYTSEVTTEPTHLAEGEKTFTCKCGDTYTESVSKLEGHTYTSEVTKEATHLAEGETTYTCACGDTYTEAIAKLTAHTYEEVVTAPTCTAQGYTTHTCACGDSYVDNYTDKLDHEYTSEVTTPATHLTEGVKTFTCKCGDTYTEPVAKLECHTYTSEVTKEATHLAEGETTYTCECGDTYTEIIKKLEGHTYEELVTEPTCTAKGYTTYTCACGDTYAGDYVGTKAHSYTSAMTRPATHLSEGVRTYTCTTCGDSYTEAIAKTKEHSYVASNTVAPTCEKEGYTVYACQCGDSYNDNYISAAGHKYEGQTCVNCGKNCSCNCHKSGFMGFIWKIILFFQKLFKTNKTCACGIAHY